MEIVVLSLQFPSHLRIKEICVQFYSLWYLFEHNVDLSLPQVSYFEFCLKTWNTLWCENPTSTFGPYLQRWPRLHSSMILFSRWVVQNVASGSSGAAGSFLLLNHLLNLPLSPLQDLHPFSIVPFSLLSPELVHILKELVPAPRCKFYSHQDCDTWKHLRKSMLHFLLSMTWTFKTGSFKS